MSTRVVKVEGHNPDHEVIGDCAKIVRTGGLVIFPTETVYGIAADFTNPSAMKRLRDVKKRLDSKPFSILIAQKSLLANYTDTTQTHVYKMIDEFWPGPLTVVVANKMTESTIGVRMPSNTIALSLVHQAQCTVAAPSANVQGEPPPLNCREALKDLDGLVDMAIDGGSVEFGRSSSVVDFSQDRPTVLREGPISQEQVDQVSQRKNVLFVCSGNSCRSVMAHYYLQHLLKDREDVQVQSAGTAVYLPTPASQEAFSVLRHEGIDASQHRSQGINHVLLRKSDLIFAMTRAHRKQILDHVPDVEKKVYLLREFANLSKGAEMDLDVPDPIGNSHDVYAQCFGLIKEAIHKIVDLV